MTTLLAGIEAFKVLYQRKTNSYVYDLWILKLCQRFDPSIISRGLFIGLPSQMQKLWSSNAQKMRFSVGGRRGEGGSTYLTLGEGRRSDMKC